MYDLQFPNIHALYRERALSQRDINLWATILLAGVMLVLVLLTIYSGAIKYWLILLLVAGVFIYRATKLITIMHGITHFDRLWKEQVRSINDDAERKALFESVDQELAGDRVVYPNFVLTETRLIAFEKLGIFPRVKDIELLFITPNVRSLRHTAIEEGPLKCELYCAFGDENIFLTDDTSVFDEILRELRLRHPSIMLDQSAREYFFPGTASPARVK